MKEIKSYKKKEQERRTDESGYSRDEYRDECDASKTLEKGKQIELKIAESDYNCTTCGSSRVRKRMIDLPLLEGKVILKRIKVLFCADCETSIIEKEGLEEVREKLCLLAEKLDTKTDFGFVREGLASYEKKWTEKAKERKVISFYFSTREGTPAKAQISLRVADPLYPKAHSLTSEEIRNMLGLQYFEDLVKTAKEQNRTISQYLKLELAKRILD